MKRNAKKCTALAGAMLLGSATFAAAQQVTEARIQELIRQAATRVGINDVPLSGSGQAGAQAAPSGQPAAPGQTTPAGQPARPVVAMTLDDAIKLALDRNLDIPCSG